MAPRPPAPRSRGLRHWARKQWRGKQRPLELHEATEARQPRRTWQEGSRGRLPRAQKADFIHLGSTKKLLVVPFEKAEKEKKGECPGYHQLLFINNILSFIVIKYT